MCKYQYIKMEGTGFCYSLQLLMCLSRLKLLRNAIKAMVWLTVAQLLSLSRERNVKPGAQCHRTDTIKQQSSSQMRMCISHFHVSSDEYSWTCFDLQHLSLQWFNTGKGAYLIKIIPSFSSLFNMEIFSVSLILKQATVVTIML